MRCTTTVILLSAAIAGAVDAAEKPRQAAAPPAAVHAPKADPREAALARLFSERESAATLQAAIEQARKQGISEQVILEARFLFLVDRHDDEGLVALLPEFAKRRATFTPEVSKIFAFKEDWLAVNEYLEALAALKMGDKDTFKKHITEAFWLSPRQGAAFAPHIDRLRLEEVMHSIKIDFSQEFATINSAKPESLKNLIGDNQALVLHFWSPWSNESEAAMPDFMRAARELLSNNIAVASVLPEDSSAILADARATLKTLGKNPPGAWIIDRKSHSLNRVLRVQTFPTMVIVATDGRILFNGHPAEDTLWETLHKINPTIRRPALADGANTP
ncbi:MAG: hypothetical protein WCP45_03250 [Verrucomicrobiota bacterium]